MGLFGSETLRPSRRVKLADASSAESAQTTEVAILEFGLPVHGRAGGDGLDRVVNVVAEDEALAVPRPPTIAEPHVGIETRFGRERRVGTLESIPFSSGPAEEALDEIRRAES